jgi:hypothetical protein
LAHARSALADPGAVQRSEAEPALDDTNRLDRDRGAARSILPSEDLTLPDARSARSAMIEATLLLAVLMAVAVVLHGWPRHR